MSVAIRPARTSDIKAIRTIIDTYSLQRRLLSKETVMLYESVQEFFVAEKDGAIIGCGALHVLWEDLGEVRTVAVNEEFRSQKIGHQILTAIIERAKSLGLKNLEHAGIAEGVGLHTLQIQEFGDTFVIRAQ